MTDRLDKVRDVARMIQQDCATDSKEVDRTPFTPRGVGERMGTNLAMIAGMARLVELLADECEALGRVVNSRTEHLA